VKNNKTANKNLNLYLHFQLINDLVGFGSGVAFNKRLRDCCLLLRLLLLLLLLVGDLSRLVLRVRSLRLVGGELRLFVLPLDLQLLRAHDEPRLGELESQSRDLVLQPAHLDARTAPFVAVDITNCMSKTTTERNSQTVSYVNRFVSGAQPT
jgi:hypothetical protein